MCCAGCGDTIPAAQAIRNIGPVAAVAPASGAAPVDPVPVGLRGEVYSASAAAVRAHRALGLLTLPAGSRRTTATTLPSASNDPSRHLVYASQWWSVPGTTRALSHFLQTHVPDGFTSSTPIRTGRVMLAALNDWDLPAKTTLTATFVRKGTSVVVRVDGGAVWLTPRSPLESIPPSIPVVYLTATGDVDTLKRVAFRGPDVSKLVPSLNDDIPAAPGLCHPTPATFVRTATFRIGHRVVAFSWTDDGCNLTRVTVNGRPSVSLVDDGLSSLVQFMMTH
jgi:hypothetical protein